MVDDRLQGHGQDADAANQRLKQLVGFLQIFEEDYSRLKGELEDAG